MSVIVQRKFLYVLVQLINSSSGLKLQDFTGTSSPSWPKSWLKLASRLFLGSKQTKHSKIAEEQVEYLERDQEEIKEIV